MTSNIEAINISFQRNSNKNENSKYFWAFIKNELIALKTSTIYLLGTVILIQLKNKLEIFRISDSRHVWSFSSW